MIVDHAGRLHQRVANCRAHELESAPQQIAAHCVGFLSPRRYVRHAPPSILYRFAADKAPEVSVEAFLLFQQREKRFCVRDRGCDLQSVSYDSGVAEQPLHFARAIAGDLFRAESIERFPIVLSFL